MATSYPLRDVRIISGLGGINPSNIDEKFSDIDGFSGNINSIFGNYRESNVAKSVVEGGSNPKYFKIALNEPVKSSIIGIGSPNTSLSNGILILRGLDGKQVRTPVDLSADSTKRGVMFFPFEETAFIEAEIQFHTDDEVTVGGAAIFTSTNVSISSISSLIAPGAQVEVTLQADEEWISEILDTINYSWIIASATSDVESAENGYIIEFCVDKTFAAYKTWDAPYTVGAGKKKTYSEQPVVRYLRIRYKNGSTGPATVVISTRLNPVASKSSSHKINDPIDGEDDGELVKSINTAFSELTGESENINSFRGALNVNTALVHKVGISTFFHRTNGVSTTIAAPGITADDYIIPLTSVVGINIGDKIQIVTGLATGELFYTITAIVASTVQLDMRVPIDIAAGAVVDTISTDMTSLAGSMTSPVVYNIHPPAGSIWQITRILISLTDGSAMDDGKFGGIAALTNGYVLRGNTSTGLNNQTNWKTNGDMALDMFDTTYTDKAPSGENGLRGRWTFTKGEFIVELDGDQGDSLEFLAQDPTVVDNTSFQVKAQGRLFGG